MFVIELCMKQWKYPTVLWKWCYILSHSILSILMFKEIMGGLKCSFKCWLKCPYNIYVVKMTINWWSIKCGDRCLVRKISVSLLRDFSLQYSSLLRQYIQILSKWSPLKHFHADCCLNLCLTFNTLFDFSQTHGSKIG